MDFNIFELFGVTIVQPITLICLILGMFLKHKTKIENKAIPWINLAVGAVLGAVFMKTMEDFPANDIINAIYIGATSGLMGTGYYEAFKNLMKMVSMEEEK